MVEFRSLDLKILGSQDAGYTIEATGPEGEWASAPLDGRALAQLDADLEAIRAGTADQAQVEKVGHLLFQALFPMNVMMVYVAARARLKAGDGLRLRLHLAPELASLPWELLYDPPFYLATDPQSPIVRFTGLPNPPQPLAVRPPLRLLHLIASPIDATALDAEQESELLRAALHDLTAEQQVEIIHGRPGTLATLGDGLRGGCHLLHFTGHGRVVRGVGYLLFEDEDGHSQPVESGTLAQLLRGTSLRLALLNACESASATDRDAFGNVAAALIRAGLPAVVAHQYAMPDRSAVAFVAEFYRALADGYPVDAAVGVGRKAILSALGMQWREHVDWAIPVLFMQVSDGRILSFEEPGGEMGDSPLRAATVVQQQVRAQGDAVTLGQVEGGVINITLGAAPSTPPEPAPSPPRDPLSELLAQLQETVRAFAPRAKRAEALARVGVLSDAGLKTPPDLEQIESVWQWFRAEVPQLSGSVLNAIAAVRGKAEKGGGEALDEFEERFGDFS